MPTIQARGIWLRWEQTGVGEPVLLVHGAGERGAVWQEHGWVRAGVRAGRRVLTLDCRGHGDSGGAAGPKGLDVAAVSADLAALLRYANARRLDVVGHGRGAAAALGLALRRPGRVASLVLLAPAGVEDAIERLGPGEGAERADVPALALTPEGRVDDAWHKRLPALRVEAASGDLADPELVSRALAFGAEQPAER